MDIDPQDREAIDDEIFEQEEQDEAEDLDDPGLESDEDIDDEVDAEGAEAIQRKRNR